MLVSWHQTLLTSLLRTFGDVHVVHDLISADASQTGVSGGCFSQNNNFKFIAQWKLYFVLVIML
jgi:hypothetical protein